MSTATHLKFSQARDHILKWIRQGEFPAGGKLPSERELARQLDIDQGTVRRGLEDLVAAGVVIKRPRVGNFVRQIRSDELAQRIAIVLPRYMRDTRHPHPVTALLMEGILGELDQRDCALSLLSYEQDQFWMDAGESMVARGIAGALIFANSDTPREQMAKLAASGIQVMLINGVGLWPELMFPSVSIDVTSPMREALERLTALGHRRIAWISYEETRFRRVEEELINEFVRRFSLESPEQIVYRIPSDFPNSFGVLSELFDRRPMPTAMVLQDEFVAHEIFRLCHRRGVRVPEDLSLVAIADSAPQSHLVALSAPNTAALWVEVARKAAEHLKAMLETGSTKRIEVSLYGSIQWKQSTTAAPADIGRGN